MSEATVEAGPVAPEPVSKRRRVVRIVSWLVGLVLLLIVLNLLGVNVRDWLKELWDSVKAISGRLHRPRLHLPVPADGADRARLVRDPALRVSRRRDVHARARGLRDGRGAERLPAREHRHVRDAAHVRRDRARRELPGRARRLRRPEDLLRDHRDADLPLPVPGHSRLVRLPVREREGRDPEPRRARARDRRRVDLPARDPAADLLDTGSRRCGPRRSRARRSSATSVRT